MKEDPLAAPGTEIGGYRVEYKLGAGGMGEVYAAVEPRIGRRVAVKILKGDLARDEASRLRFEREARSVTLLRHPAIVDVFAFGQLENGRPYFVMPLYEGKSLREVIAQKGFFAPDEAWRIAREIAEALGIAHAAGILHRDLKPDNIFIANVPGRPPQPVLLDFGLAKVIDPEADDVRPEDLVKLTSTGVPIGTPIYMAPEQWWSNPPSGATDQYAFGVMLFEMLAGRPPFNSQKFAELLQQHLHSEPPTLASVGRSLDESIDAFLSRLMKKDPKDRFPSFAEVIEVGDAAFDGVASGPKRISQAVTPSLEAALRRSSASASSTADARRSTKESPTAAEPSASQTNDVDAMGLTAPPELASISLGILRDQTTEPSASQMGATLDPRPFGPRTLGAYLLCIALTLSTLVAIGYAGEARWDLKEWVKMAGFGSLLTLGIALIALVLLPILNSRRVQKPAVSTVLQILAIFPAAGAIFGSYTGLAKVLAGVESLSREDANLAFEILHMGRYEIGSGDLLGFGFAAALALGLTALLGSPLPAEPWRALRSPWAAAGAVGFVAIPVFLVFGIESPIFTIAVGSAALLWMARASTAPTSLAHELAVAALSATVSARGASQVRADVHAATSWSNPPTRAERVVAMVEASHDRTVTAIATTVMLILVCMAAVHVVIRADRTITFEKSNRKVKRLLAAGQLAFVIGLFALSVNIDRMYEARRAEMIEGMRNQLVLFAKLSPPTLEGHDLPRPVPSPSLQVTADSIALNGKFIGKLSALDSESGRQAIAAAMIAALASPTPTSGRSVDLSLLVDRSVAWTRVEELLGIAYEGGARTADFLLTRGAEPMIPKDAPQEVAILLPRDFGAMTVSLETEGVEPEGVAFGEVAGSLLKRRTDAEAPLPIRVRRARR